MRVPLWILLILLPSVLRADATQYIEGLRQPEIWYYPGALAWRPFAEARVIGTVNVIAVGSTPQCSVFKTIVETAQSYYSTPAGLSPTPTPSSTPSATSTEIPTGTATPTPTPFDPSAGSWTFYIRPHPALRPDEFLLTSQRIDLYSNESQTTTTIWNSLNHFSEMIAHVPNGKFSGHQDAPMIRDTRLQGDQLFALAIFGGALFEIRIDNVCSPNRTVTMSAWNADNHTIVVGDVHYGTGPVMPPPIYFFHFIPPAVTNYTKVDFDALMNGTLVSREVFTPL